MEKKKLKKNKEHPPPQFEHSVTSEVWKLMQAIQEKQTRSSKLRQLVLLLLC